MGAEHDHASDPGIEGRLLAFFTAALVVIWALVAWQTRQTEANAVLSVENRVSDLALAFAEHTHSTFQDADHVLRELRALARMPGADFQAEIQNHQALLAGITHQVGVMDARGRLSFTNLDPRPAPVDLSDREHFKVFVDRPEDRLFISRPVMGRVSGKWSIQLARPILDAQGLQGVIVISVDPASLVRFHEKIHLGSNGLVSVVRDSGEILSRNIGFDKYIGQKVSMTPHGLPGAPLAGTFRRLSQADQIERIHGYIRLPDYGVTVIVGADVAEALAPVRARNLVLLGITVILTLALGFQFWARQRKARLQNELRQERERRQRMMEALNRDFVTLLENTSDFIYFKDRESRIRFCSRTLAEITGHTDWRQMIGKHDREVFPPDTARVYEDEEKPVFEEGKALLGKVDPYYDQAGRPGWVSTNKWPVLAEDGKTVIGLFGISRDITAQVRAEEEYRRSNDELQRFAYIISHDLQEPLRMVSSYSTLLGRRYKGRLDAEADEFIAFAVDGAKRMQQMIDDLLDYSRISRSATPLALVSLDTCLDLALANLQLAIDEAGARITRQPLPELIGDETQLMRLLQNLIGNALKYRAPDRRPTVDITCRENAEGWAVSIADNGIGIEPRHHRRIFEVFQRLHGREKYPGTGIGLAVCRSIVERHGGRIEVDSVPEQGSIFTVFLPRRPPPTAAG